MLPLTLQNFDELVNKAGYSIVAFSAIWVRQAGPSFTIIENPENQLQFVKNPPLSSLLIGSVDFDSQRELVDRFSIRELPTFIGFKEGKVVNISNCLTSYDDAFGKLLGLTPGEIKCGRSL